MRRGRQTRVVMPGNNHKRYVTGALTNSPNYMPSSSLTPWQSMKRLWLPQGQGPPIGL